MIKLVIRYSVKKKKKKEKKKKRKIENKELFDKYLKITKILVLVNFLLFSHFRGQDNKKKK